MLQNLSIKNFALIDSLSVGFKEGFSTITGETGAGKSIILGGLSHILGKRADLSSLKNKDQKCIIEGEFFIKNYNLQNLFSDLDIDYDDVTIIRREILPSGKSRAFVNDSPVTLAVLNQLGDKLIDIHSQHEILELADKKYQFAIIDAIADNAKYLDSYKRGLVVYNAHKNELEALLEKQKQSEQEYEYNLFLFNELNDAALKSDEQEELETLLEKLTNVEAIKTYFTEAIEVANNEEFGLKATFNTFKNTTTKLTGFDKEYQSLQERINSVFIEFNDIADELEKQSESISYSPEKIESYNNRLQLLYDLQKKHQVTSVEELLAIKENLSVKVQEVDNASDILNKKTEELKEITEKLNRLADIIHKNRSKVIPKFIKELEQLLSKLSMDNTQFKVNISKHNQFLPNGKSELEFLFSANKGSSFESLKKAASGGEMSRIMLAVKALVSNYSNLPTILFDEIDSGVSGEVSNKMAEIMSVMGKNMQVISITHLPQIASKGTAHYKVYKKDTNNVTVTNIKKLTQEERVIEIAEMISGKNISESAINHAKQLLN